MAKIRKTYTPELKAEIILRTLREEETVTQIASEYGVHPNQLMKWRAQFVKDAATVFRNDDKPLKELKAKYDKQVEELYAEVGRLTTQLHWLKKKCGIRVE